MDKVVDMVGDRVIRAKVSVSFFKHHRDAKVKTVHLSILNSKLNNLPQHSLLHLDKSFTHPRRTIMFANSEWIVVTYKVENANDNTIKQDNKLTLEDKKVQISVNLEWTVAIGNPASVKEFTIKQDNLALLIMEHRQLIQTFNKLKLWANAIVFNKKTFVTE